MQKEAWERAIDDGRPWTDAEAARALAACDASGMSTAAFARMHNVTPGKIYFWRKTLTAKRRTKGRLVPVTVVSEHAAAGATQPRVVVSHGRLRLDIEGVSPEWVATLIRLIRESEE